MTQPWDCPRCLGMHRRAQEAESRAAKTLRQNDTDRLWQTVAELKWRADYARRSEMRWRQLYKEAADMIRESGLVETMSCPGILEGRLHVLVGELIAVARRPLWQRFKAWVMPVRGGPHETAGQRQGEPQETKR